jgi:hypothetical protein
MQDDDFFGFYGSLNRSSPNTAESRHYIIIGLNKCIGGWEGWGYVYISLVPMHSLHIAYATLER